MPKNNDAGLLFRNGRSFRIFVTSLKIQNLDSISTHFSDFVTENQKKNPSEGLDPAPVSEKYKHSKLHLFIWYSYFYFV